MRDKETIFLGENMSRDQTNDYQRRKAKSTTVQVRCIAAGVQPVLSIPRNRLRVALGDARKQVGYLGADYSKAMQGAKHAQLLEAWTARLREILARMKELGMT